MASQGEPQGKRLKAHRTGQVAQRGCIEWPLLACGGRWGERMCWALRSEELVEKRALLRQGLGLTV